ncbi:MAG TPA: hypothetical protein VFH03_14800, partial [Actinoplanes sp.]|nr:hypothetical protein [Actinoplanes sp.]
MDDHAAHALSFGPAAEIYERGRPPYPEAALDWLLTGADSGVFEVADSDVPRALGSGETSRLLDPDAGHARGLLDLGGGRSSRAPGPSDGDAPRPLNPGDGRSSRAPGPSDGDAPRPLNPGDGRSSRAPGP